MNKEHTPNTGGGGYYKPIDTRTAQQKAENTLERITENIQKKNPHYSKEQCRYAAKQIMKRK